MLTAIEEEEVRERMEVLASIHEGLQDIAEGRSMPAHEALEEIGQKLNLPAASAIQL